MFVPFAENPQPKWYIGAKHTDNLLNNIKNGTKTCRFFLFSVYYTDIYRFIKFNLL